MTIEDLLIKYGSVRNFIYEVYFVPAISLGVDYNTLLGLTPISYNVIIKGLKKRKEEELKEKDYLNYLLSMYILGGLVGKGFKEPLLSNVGVEVSEEELFKQKKEKFIRIVEKINKNFEGKE